MGTNVPSSRKQRLEWIEGLIAQWNTNQAIIGLSAVQITSLATDIANARGALTSADNARADSKAKTSDYYIKADAVHKKASEYLALIKGTAKTSTTPSAVYLAAGITPADPPSPAPAPSLPAIDSATITSDGSVTLDFSATGPTGTVWQISRKLAGEPALTIIGNANPDTKQYIDATIPAGTVSATYRIGGVRGGLVGPSSVDFEVKLGAAPDAAQNAAA